MPFGWMFTDEIVFTKLIKILLVVPVTLTIIIFCRKSNQCVYASVGYTTKQHSWEHNVQSFSDDKSSFTYFTVIPNKFHKFKIVKKKNEKNKRKI